QNRQGISLFGCQRRARTVCARIWPLRSDFQSTGFVLSRPMSAEGSAARDSSTKKTRLRATWRLSSAGPSSGSRHAARISSPPIKGAKGDDIGAGPQAGWHYARFEGTRGRESRRLSELPFRDTAAAHDGDGAGLLPDSKLLRGGGSGLYQYHPHRSLSRRGEAGVGVEYRAVGRQSGARIGDGPSGNPA